MTEKSTERSVIKDKSDNENIPDLRFPEFDENWKSFLLSELGSFKNGVNKSKNDFGIGNPFVNLENIFENRSLKNKNFNLVKVSKKELKEYNLKKGDVLFVRSSVKPEGVGLTSVLLENLDNTVYSGFIIRFRSNEKLNVLFKQFCFSTFSIRKQILAKCSTSANTNINQESLKKITINIPNINEQEKISDFLSAIDKKIDLMEKKYNCLIKTRKYFLNSLFCYNENIPQLRFPEFNNDWVEENYYKHLNIMSGKGFKASEYTNSGIPLIKIDNIGYGKIKWKHQDFLPEEYLDKYPDLSLEKEDLLLALNRPITNGELKFTQLKEEDVPSILYQRVGKIIFKDEMLDKNFAYYLLRKYIYKFVITTSVGSDQPFISTNQLKKMKMKIPCINEQEKIGEFLSVIDRKIEFMEKQIKYYKKFKETLLSKMFC